MKQENLSKDCAQESYERIIIRIKEIYCDKITDEGADEAARNLIGLCRMIMDYKAKGRRISEKRSKKRDKEVKIGARAFDLSP